ncbi:MAG: outer membrane beta-barrel protein [Tannerellaceae bacterium]|jgi:hypothetical protein|nr:outer membrane beta-barrel protein [Tannerellaceae bacterium]
MKSKIGKQNLDKFEKLYSYNDTLQGGFITSYSTNVYGGNRKKCFLLLALMLTCICLQAQVRIAGTVAAPTEDGKTEEIPLAQVILRSIDDTTKIAFGTVTDLQGKFTFDNVPLQEFQLEISYIGYMKHQERIKVVKPENGHTITLNRSLQPDVKQLNEVTVTAKTVRSGLDKTTYLISPEEIKSARYSKDLLEKIPDIKIDPVSQKLKSSRGALKILINGISATDADLQAIAPNKVLRVEYYDLPPARYVEYNSVVNIITKPLDDGYSGGIEIRHAFTTGFFDDNVFLSYNKGRHRFSADYSVSFRDYDDIRDVETYDYAIPEPAYSSKSTPVRREKLSEDKFGYDQHYINLKYNVQEDNNYIFQAKFSPSVLNSHNSDNSDIRIRYGNDGTEARTGWSNNKSNYFNPTLNLYFWKKIAEKQSLTFDVIGNMFNTNQNIIQQEINVSNDVAIIDDRMELKNLKKSLIGEVVYEKSLAGGTFQAGDRVETYNMQSTVRNSFGNPDYTSTYFSDYLYADYGGVLGKANYKLSVGLTYKRTRNARQDYSAWIFRPQVVVGYNIDHQNMLRLIMKQAPKEPTLSQQSDNVIFITDNIWETGNPNLRNSIERSAQLIYSFNNKYVYLNAYLNYSDISNAIASFYIPATGAFPEVSYMHQPINQKYERSFYGLLSASVMPLGNNKLMATIGGYLQKTMIQNDAVQSYSFWDKPLQFNVRWSPNDHWNISYNGSIKSYSYNNGYIKTAESGSHHLSVRYTKKRYSFNAGILSVFAPLYYDDKTIEPSAVRHTSERKIFDNRNMVTLGITYTFSSGKKYNEQGKRIQNNDSDAGVFK